MGSTTASAPVATPTRRRMRRFGLIPVVLAGALLLASCMSPDQQASFDRINVSRAWSSIHTLQQDNTAQAKAQAWAEHLARTNQLAHSNLASGMDDQWRSLAENVGYGSSVANVHDQFMGSSGHRNNVMSTRFTHVGVGVAQGHGRTFVVQVFVQR